MPIDHASREPDDPPDPLPTTTTRAIRNLFNSRGHPEPESSPSAFSNFDMHILTWRAVEIRGDLTKGQFRCDDFALAVQEEFGLKRPPGRDWCREVLRKVGYVTEYPFDTFKVQTG